MVPDNSKTSFQHTKCQLDIIYDNLLQPRKPRFFLTWRIIDCLHKLSTIWGDAINLGPLGILMAKERDMGDESFQTTTRETTVERKGYPSLWEGVAKLLASKRSGSGNSIVMGEATGT